MKCNNCGLIDETNTAYCARCGRSSHSLVQKTYQFTCMICGFVTNSYRDIVFHLAQEQVYEKEDCNKKIIDLKEVD